MKKITAISAASAVALSGLAFAVPANAATLGDVSLPLSVSVYETQHNNASVDYTSTGLDWSNGGYFAQDIVTAGCDTLPSYITLSGNFYDGDPSNTPNYSDAGMAPVLAVISDAPAGSAATYNICLTLSDQVASTVNGSFKLQVINDAIVDPAPVDPTPVDPTPTPVDPTPTPVDPTPVPVDPTPTPVDPTPVPPAPVVDNHHHDGDHDGDHKDKVKEVKKKIEKKISEHANKLPEKAKADFNKILEQVKKAFSKFRF